MIDIADIVVVMMKMKMAKRGWLEGSGL